MANFSTYKNLELPTEPEHYNIGVFNKNTMVIDSELHKLDIKNQSQDELLATKESLNSEIARAKSEQHVQWRLKKISVWHYLFITHQIQLIMI